MRPSGMVARTHSSSPRRATPCSRPGLPPPAAGHAERAHRVGANPVAGELAGQHLGEAQHAASRRGERAEPGFADDARGRREVHDRAAVATLDHPPGARPGAEPHGRQVRVERRRPGAGVEVDERAVAELGAGPAREVAAHVDPSERVDGRGDGVLHRVLIGELDRQGQAPAAFGSDRSGGGVERVAAHPVGLLGHGGGGDDVDAGDVGAEPGEEHRGGASDPGPAGRAGDPHDVVGEVDHGSVSRSRSASTSRSPSRVCPPTSRKRRIRRVASGSSRAARKAAASTV